MPTQKTVKIARMAIPVDETGHVPESALLKRYDDFYEDQQQEYDAKRFFAAMEGKKLPNINLARRDYMNSSDEVVPLKCTPAQVAAWWHDPTSMDVQDIDTAGAPKVNIPKGMTPAQQRDQGKIKVISTPMEEAKVRRTLVMTYEPSDVHKFAESRPTITVAPEPIGKDGIYYPSRTRIELDRKQGLDQGTLAHEGAHHLRATDPNRHDPIIKTYPQIGVEESCTVAEQMARSDAPDYTGYYWQVAVYDPKKHVWRKPTGYEARRMAEEDHQLFTEGRGKGLKGQDATDSVRRHWSESHIARLRLGCNKMAVNIMADDYGNVQKVSMAKPRTVKAAADVAKITNATAGRPGVATANRAKQTTLFYKSKK